MSNLKTAVALDNEILKAEDFTLGYDSSIDNVAVAMKAILSGAEKSYIIGGKVSPYSSGGLNVSISPIYAFENSTGECVAETEVTEPVSFEEADSELDRIDIIEVKMTKQLYDIQQRKFWDPSAKTETTEKIATKYKAALCVVVKKGSNGSSVAPVVDSGYVKIAEVIIPAGTNNITAEYIKNVDARKAGVANSSWTANQDSTFNPGYLAEIFHSFLVAHNEDGTHRNDVIGADSIAFGTETGKVKGSIIPTGQSCTIHKVDFSSQESIATLITALVTNVNNLYPFANNILCRFSFLADLPVASSTENVDVATGGEQTIDGITCSIGQLVFLKDQLDAKENGFYEVQSGAWNRYSGYTSANSSAFSNKFITITNGTANAGKIFYLEDDSMLIGTDELHFNIAIYTFKETANSVALRDTNGRTKVQDPAENKDCANKYYTDYNIERNTGTHGLGFSFANERFVTFAFSDTAHKSIKIKAGTHIRLDIVTEGVTEKRWFDADTDRTFNLATMMQTAADASSTRTGQINGRDFYLYLVPSGTGVDIVVSCNATFPNDISATYTANSTRKIGQFHTLCVAVNETQTTKVAASPSTETAGNKYLLKQYNSSDSDGFYDFYNKTISSVSSNAIYDVVTVPHPLAGFAAGDILPESVFCLSFKPHSVADGMVYDVDTDIAVDIYLQSGKGRLTKSVYGGSITDTRQQQNHQDDMRQVRKRLLWDYEFTSIASGSNEGTNIAGSADPGTTGGHNDTAGIRMVSLIGCEDCCGALSQWLENVSANGGSEWTVYDGNGAFGNTYGASYALLAGGDWSDAAACGSRCRNAHHVRSYAGSIIGGRGASRVIRYA